MKYTLRKNGRMMANIRPPVIAVTREDLQEYNMMAKAVGYKSFRNFLKFNDLVFELSELYDHEMKQREPRSDG